MAITNTITYSWSGPNSLVSPLSVTSTGNTAVTVNEVVSNGTGNVAIPSVLFNYPNLQSCFLYADGNITVKTNNATTPSASNQVFSLEGNVPLAWSGNGTGNNPFTANVSNGLFAQNVSGANVTLRCQFLFN